MKINLFETHDRLQHLKKDQSQIIAEGCEECLKRHPRSLAIQARCPYVYIFAHARTTENGIDKRLLWQPRLVKPKAQTNSYLFRAKSHSDIVEVCWDIPNREMWNEYKKGNLVQNEVVIWSIHQFLNNREALESAHPEDLPDERLKQIMLDIARCEDEENRMKKLYATQETSEPYQASYWKS